MNEIFAQLSEIQARMTKIEGRILSLADTSTVEELDTALATLEDYLNQIRKLENLILNKKVSLLEKKVTSITNDPVPTDTTVS